mgnify:CR=1 FL=1
MNEEEFLIEMKNFFENIDYQPEFNSYIIRVNY